MATKHYAWSDIWNGGEVQEVPVPSVKGLTKTVVANRNVITAGSEITKSKSGLSDDDWDRMIASGVIRPYPLPDGADERTSPANAFLREVLDERGNVDVQRLMEMGFATPGVATNVVEEGEEARTLESPAGV